MLRDPDRFDAWIGRLLVRACYREARRQQRRTIVESSVRAIGLGPDPSGEVLDRDELARGFERLDPEQRALIVHHYYLGLPIATTAEILGLPVGTVKSRLHRATRSMRATLDADARRAALERGPA